MLHKRSHTARRFFCFVLSSRVLLSAEVLTGKD